MIPMVRCSRARCLTRCSRRDANDSAIRECCLGCTCPSLAPNLPQIGRELGSRLVLFGTVSNSGGLLLANWRCGAGRARGRHILIHPIELRFQLNQFAEFFRRW